VDAVTEQEESDFGKGFVYCIGLFLGHADAYHKERKCLKMDLMRDEVAKVWISGASDHLIELQVPENLPPDIKKKVGEFTEKVFELRSCGCKHKDVLWTIKEAQDILIEVDKYSFELNTVEASMK
jgi:hypothetical protein